MTLSPRQWLVLAVLIGGFAVAALVVRDDSTPSTRFDEAAWCGRAAALAGLGPILDGTAEAVTSSDLERVRDAIYDVEILAPEPIQPGLARLSDMNFQLRETIGDEGWPAAYVTVRARVDTDEVERALRDLDTELLACGHRLFG